MRHINIEELEVEEDWPPGKNPHHNETVEKWRERLREAEEELRNASDKKARSKIFDRYSDLWSDVKVWYRKISYDKCWYCESSTLRIPGDIDHYRPKGKVEGISHPGYWWLAFDWRNWRFACKYCNSRITDLETGIVGGKGTHFPLLDGEKCRVQDVCDYEALFEEDPLLLDPVEPGDSTLLTFTSDGLPGPAKKEPAEGENPSVEYLRAKRSIELYHLDHSSLTRARRRIYIQVRNHVNEYQHYQEKWEKEHNHSDRMLAKKAKKALSLLISPKAEYSMTARAYLREYRKDDPEWEWVDRLLTAS
jgi:hypothetical protein